MYILGQSGKAGARAAAATESMSVLLWLPHHHPEGLALRGRRGRGGGEREEGRGGGEEGRRGGGEEGRRGGGEEGRRGGGEEGNGGEEGRRGGGKWRGDQGRSFHRSLLHPSAATHLLPAAFGPPVGVGPFLTKYRLYYAYS